jgi:hypothetical protein
MCAGLQTFAPIWLQLALVQLVRMFPQTLRARGGQVSSSGFSSGEEG